MRKNIPLRVAFLPILLTVSLLILTVLFLNIPLYLPLVFGYFFTLFISRIYGYSTWKLAHNSYQGVKSIAAIFLILLLIGVLIAIWSGSGTTDALVYYGLAMVNPKYLAVTGFVASTFVSLLLGTSVGTASTIGVAFIGMANSLEVNPNLVAGAVVSGAFIGDRTSPLSSAAHINSLITGTDYYKNVKELMKTLFPALLITITIYTVIGLLYGDVHIDTGVAVNIAREQIKSVYGSISLWLLLPPMLIMILAMFRVPIKTNLTIAILSGALLAYIFQGREVLELIKIATFGYEHNSGRLFGGAWNMFNQILLILAVGFYYGLLDASGILDVLLEKMTNSMNNRWKVIQRTMFISIASAMLSATQVMGILVPGKVMLKYYNMYQMNPKLLNRAISDSGLVFAGLIPWNLNAILLGIALNIPVIYYAPFAYLLIILPVYSYFYSKRNCIKKEGDLGRILAK